MKQSKPRVVNTRLAGPDHAVRTIVGGKGTIRPTPCAGCPWIKANDGMFPAEAFKHSAPTSYDMAEHIFACHESGAEKPATCAGFLLRGAANNLTIRIKISKGEFHPSKVSEGGYELHKDYRSMSIANGVDPDDPVLAPCR